MVCALALSEPDSLNFSIEHLPGPVVDELWTLASSDLVAWCLLAAVMTAGVETPRPMPETARLLASVEADERQSLPLALRTDRRFVEVAGWVSDDRLRQAASTAGAHLTAVV